MKQKGSIAVILLIIVLLLVAAAAAYFFFLNPRAQIDRSIQPDTSAENVGLKDNIAPRAEINENGYNMKAVVSPSNNNIIKGSVTITAEEVDPAAAGIGFFITDNPNEFNEGLPNLGMDQVGTDGWSYNFDTTKQPNGTYYLIIIAYPEGGEGNPLGIAQIPVQISN